MMIMTMSYKAHNIVSNLNIRQGWHYPNETIESAKERPYMLLYLMIGRKCNEGGNDKVEVFKERGRRESEY